MMVPATVGVAKDILSVSTLGFLGFGVQLPDPEWGTLLMEGKDYLFTAEVSRFRVYLHSSKLFAIFYKVKHVFPWLFWRQP